ncbi:Rho-binding antiterminator [Marinomonas epiphytica]
MLTCQQYDYIELVCMYRYPVKLIMEFGEVVLGTAWDTTRNDLGEESIKLKGLDGEEKIHALHEILELEVMEDNPHFKILSLRLAQAK